LSASYIYVNQYVCVQVKIINLRSVSIILFLSILVSLTIHWINLSKKKSEIERLDDTLKEIKQLIPKSTRISFLSNLTENSPKLELYFQTQFVMCPVILSEQSQDTFLFIQKGDMKYDEIQNSDTIMTSSMYDFKTCLFHKRK